MNYIFTRVFICLNIYENEFGNLYKLKINRDSVKLAWKFIKVYCTEWHLIFTMQEVAASIYVQRSWFKVRVSAGYLKE